MHKINTLLKTHLLGGVGSALAICSILVLSLAPSVQAGVYNIRVNTPAQSNVGSNFTVYVRSSMVKDGAATGAVSGKLLYPANLVKLITVKPSDYPGVSLSFASGGISVSAPSKGAGNGYGGDMTVFYATFTALAAGSATFSANGGAMIVNGTNHTVDSGTTRIYSQYCPSGQVGTPPSCSTPVVTPTPTPPSAIPTPTPTPPASTTPPSSSSGSSSTTSTTQPAVSTQTTAPASGPTASPQSATSNQNAKISVSKPQGSTTAIAQPAPETGVSSGPSTVGLSVFELEVTANQATLSFNPTGALHGASVRYGLKKSNLDQTATITATDPAIQAIFSSLTPGTTYYYRFEALDTQDQQIAYENSLTSLGYPVRVALVSKGKSVANTRVYIGTNAYSSDGSGTVATNLAAGTYTITDSNRKNAQKITVKKATTTSGETVPQDYTYNVAAAVLATNKTSSSVGGIVVLLCTIAAAVAGGAVWWRRRRQAYLMSLPVSAGPSDLDVVTAMYEQATAPQAVPNTSSNVGSAPPVQNAHGYHNVSLADMVSQPASIDSSRKEDDDYDPFLHDSPFAQGKDIATSTDPQTHVEHHYK